MSCSADDVEGEVADVMLNLCDSVYHCDQCGKESPPEHIKPLSEEEGGMLTACGSCGLWPHNMCGYDLSTRKYLLRCAEMGAPPQSIVICLACRVVWAQDPYNLNQGVKICVANYKRAMCKAGMLAKATLRTSQKKSGGCHAVGIFYYWRVRCRKRIVVHAVPVAHPEALTIER